MCSFTGILGFAVFSLTLLKCQYVLPLIILLFFFQVTKELKNLNKKVVECTWDSETKQWKFLRVREDKSFPNGYNTAISKGQQLFS